MTAVQTSQSLTKQFDEFVTLGLSNGTMNLTFLSIKVFGATVKGILT